MKCRECGAAVEKSRWFTGHWISEVLVAQILFVPAFVLFLAISLVHWSLFVVLAFAVVYLAGSFGRFTCPKCGKSEIRKLEFGSGA